MSRETRASVEKILGADTEFGNFIVGRPDGTDTCDEAARRLVAAMPGVMARRPGAFANTGSAYGATLRRSDEHTPSLGAWGSAWNPQDRERRFLRENGSSNYVDLSHSEYAASEVRSASDFVAMHHAMLRLAQGALASAQARMVDGERLKLHANNSDGMDHSYGAHLNFLVTRQAWNDIITRRPHYQGFLAAHQVSSIAYTGQGKVGSENGRPAVDFQLSQRADFFETMCSLDTTVARPIVNSRDESLCGDADDALARLHVIFFDNTLCHLSTYLKVGTMQLVLAMIEAGEVDLELQLDDPLAAVVAFSHDPSLAARARLAGGGDTNALELQRGMLDAAKRHGNRSGFPTVPEAETILERWEDTLCRLETRELEAVSDRLDWALKLEFLEQARQRSAAQGRELAWDGPELKHLDLLYSSVDPDEGFYWRSETADVVLRLVSDEAIERFTREPPDDTRAWLRTRLLRHFDADDIERVDWDFIEIETRGPDGHWRRARIAMDDPRESTRERTEALFDDALANPPDEGLERTRLLS